MSHNTRSKTRKFQEKETMSATETYGNSQKDNQTERPRKIRATEVAEASTSSSTVINTPNINSMEIDNEHTLAYEKDAPSHDQVANHSTEPMNLDKGKFPETNEINNTLILIKTTPNK
jgi:hypothetical protein